METLDIQTDIFNPVMYTRPPKPAHDTITKGQAPTYLIKNPNLDIKIPVLAIYPNRIVVYSESERIWQRSLIGIQNEGKPANDTGGKISLSAKKRIMNAVNWLYYLSKEKTTKKGQSFFKFRINPVSYYYKECYEFFQLKNFYHNSINEK